MLLSRGKLEWLSDGEAACPGPRKSASASSSGKLSLLIITSAV